MARLGAMEAALALAAAGAAFKIAASAYGSKAALVDGLSCAANLAAGYLLYSSIRESRRPPDEDHPYGHHRLVYRGIVYMLVIYSFIAGAGAATVYYGSLQGYRVEPGAPALLAVGTLLYAASIATARRSGYAGEAYAAFSASEVLEGVLSTASSLAGASLSYLADAAGAAVITGYLVVEVAREARRLGVLVSDYAPPRLREEVRRLLEERGLRVERLRLRTLVPGRYHGDAVVEAPGMPYEVADLLADEAAYEAARRLNVDLVVHVEASGRGSRRRHRP